MKKLMPVLLMRGADPSPVPRAALAQQQLTDPVVGKIKTDIARRFRDEKTNVTIRLRNGSELKGRITQAAENMFTLKEKNSGANQGHQLCRRDEGERERLKQRSKVRYTHRDCCGRSYNRCFNQFEEFRSF